MKIVRRESQKPLNSGFYSQANLWIWWYTLANPFNFYGFFQQYQFPPHVQVVRLVSKALYFETLNERGLKNTR